MPFKTSVTALVRDIATPLCIAAAVALLGAYLLELQVPLIADRNAVVYAAIFGCLGIVSVRVCAENILSVWIDKVSTVVMPLLLAACIGLGLAAPDWYGGWAVYIYMLLATSIACRFWPVAGTHTPALPEKAGREQSKYVYTALLLIALGAVLCVTAIVTRPSVGVDEAHSANAAYGILSSGLPTFPGSETVYSRSWVNLYSIAASYSIFGFNEISARIPSAIAYLLAITVFVLAAKKLAGAKVALTGLFLLLINPWVLHYGSYARMYIFLLLFSLTFVWLMIRYLETNSPRILFVYLPLTIALGLFSERTFLMFVPAYGLLVLWHMPRTKAFWKRMATFVLVPGVAIAVVAGLLFYAPIAAFVSRYIIGFNSGGNVFANLQLQFVPLRWFAYYGIPTAVAILSTILITLRGTARHRVLLVLFWFGTLLVDVLIYSNFPARRANYAFILVGMYALVVASGAWIYFSLAHKLERVALGAFLIGFGVYTSFFVVDIPRYADFSQIGLTPPGSLVIGYPTSPMAFYNIKLAHGATVRPFITDDVERVKYEQNGLEIYTGQPFVTGVSELNELRAREDVYVMFEKTRLTFLNFRTKEYVFTTCEPVTESTRVEVATLIATQYQLDQSDLTTTLLLRCPKLPAEVPVLQ